ncbi:CinA family protein [Microbulbifer sp. THAF38]|uniref:CinA family protein n=1 Tax=Microbulbifer sp. THAF38 TaxID=2587856 RepID=UPI00126986CA|nr:CinA family protein [Microbulbifer sp. THAF38]QFT54104.1 Nicotinamide-nucleotide amidohydrolase PncC [Microbulbifer sp. THAF38]
MVDHGEITMLAQKLGEELGKRHWFATSAESCTGGAIAAAITTISGASNWFDGSIVSYADRIKHSVLGVDVKDLKQFGAVSEPVARQMACGVLAMMDANLSVAVSGIAGPNGGTEEKPVGTVWIAWAHAEGQEPVQIDARCFHFQGDRATVQAQAVVEAIKGMLAILDDHPV